MSRLGTHDHTVLPPQKQNITRRVFGHEHDQEAAPCTGVKPRTRGRRRGRRRTPAGVCTAPSDKDAGAGPAAGNVADAASLSSHQGHFECYATVRGHENAIAAIKFSPNGDLVCSGGADGKCLIADVLTGEVKRILRTSNHAEMFSAGRRPPGINDVAWHSSNDYVGIASDAGASVWDITTGCMCLRLNDHGGDPSSYPFLNVHRHLGGAAVSSSSASSSSSAASTKNSRHAATLTPTLSINFNPQGNLAITGSLDGVVRLWDVRSGNCVLSIEAHSRRICAVAFNADGKRFVTSSFDGLCRVWDTLNGQCCTTIVSPSMGSRGVPAVSAARFSPNGEYLLLSTLDSAVRLWDVGAGSASKLMSAM